MVRLAPTFMLGGSLTPYPGLADGALTTWIYGPLPLLMNLPGLLASDAIGALLITAMINLGIAVFPLAITVRILAKKQSENCKPAYLWPLLAAIALWPNANLLYLQADNTAIAAALLSMACLQSSKGAARPLTWLAATGAAAATWSKQPYLLIIPAQLVWLAIVANRACFWRYLCQCAIIGLSLTGIFVSWFGWGPLWLNMVMIPGQLPWATDIATRLFDFKWHLAGWIVLPLLSMLIWRRKIWRAESHFLLPMLMWLALLPMGLMGALRVGGATNSLAGGLMLVPVSAIWGYDRFRQLRPRAAPFGAAALVALIICLQIVNMPIAPLSPRTQHLKEATQIAATFPEQIYFPWHPLITWFSDGRFYHTEDGLYTRRMAGIELPSFTNKEGFFPAHWHVTAVPGWRHQGTYTAWHPPHTQAGQFESWTVYFWELRSISEAPAEPHEEKP